MMSKKINGLIVTLLRRIISPKATPIWAILSVTILGIFLAIGVFESPEFTSIIIVTLTIFTIIYLSYLAYLVKNETIRLSNVAGVPNYPYKTMVSEHTWYLDDPSGEHARLEKKKVIKVLEPISYISEYGWGDGQLPKLGDIKIGSGEHTPIRIYEQGSRYVIEIKLDKEYQRGQEIALFYSKELNDSFLDSEEWVETLVTTNVGKTVLMVVFPEDRPPISARAIHRHGDYVEAIPLGHDLFIESITDEGKRTLRWTIPNPVQRDLYTIEWKW